MKCGLLIIHCKSYSKGEIRCCMTRDPAKIILKRSINLSKTHVLLSIAIAANGMNRTAADQNGKMAHTYERMGGIEWGVGELEWEAWMRQLDGAVSRISFA